MARERTDRPSQYPKATIRGGPLGRSTTLEIDGRPVERVHRVDVSFDVNDVVRLTTYQFVEADVEWQFTEGTEKRVFTAVVNVPEEEGREGQIIIEGRREVARATADTIWQALADCARQLQLKEGHEEP